METQECDIGVVGLGVMGRNLLLNMLDHGYSTAGLDTDTAKARSFIDDARNTRASVTTKPQTFVAMLREPRAIILLVPAGPPVDAVIRELLPLLSPGDLLIDAGNSHFTDTDRRSAALADKGIHFFGMGVSGGESGARHGPSMMPGGPKDAYQRVRPMLEAIAAKVGAEPCVAYLGSGSAGHYVKMVHNGIEYGLMQLIAETYDLMRRGLGFDNKMLHEVFDSWNKSELHSFLIEITAAIFLKQDDRTGKPLIDLVRDVARQKGTGKWTSQNAMDLQTSIPTIDAAVAARDLSGYNDEREAASRVYIRQPSPFQGDAPALLTQLRRSLYAAMIITYAQGLALLRRASEIYNYDIDLEAVARIWRGGCIIRAAVLDDIRAAFHSRPEFPNLLLDPRLAETIATRQADLRAVVKLAVELAIPSPALMASLAYFDGYRSDRLPANLIQAQRDFFGAHTYERTDEDGVFHTKWS